MSTAPIANGDTRAPAVIELLTRPDRFFPLRSAAVQRVWLILLGYSMGVAGVIERLTLGSFVGRLDAAQADWATYWAFCLGGGAVMGPVAVWLSAILYKVRLRFCGVRGVGLGSVVPLAVLTGAVVSVPSVFDTLYATLILDTPADASTVMLGTEITQIVFPIWAIFVSYHGVRASFTLPTGAARFWFAWAPALLSVITLGGLAIGLLASGGMDFGALLD